MLDSSRSCGSSSEKSSAHRTLQFYSCTGVQPAVGSYPSRDGKPQPRGYRKSGDARAAGANPPRAFRIFPGSIESLSHQITDDKPRRPPACMRGGFTISPSFFESLSFHQNIARIPAVIVITARQAMSHPVSMRRIDRNPLQCRIHATTGVPYNPKPGIHMIRTSMNSP